MGSISTLSNQYLQSVLSTALQNTGLTTNNAGTTATSGAKESQQDSNQISPFAQVMSTLQQLQESDPSKYQQVTEQIATNLQAAAQTAQSGGDSKTANQLNQLATDFTNASQSGQLPNVQDLAGAMGGDSSHGGHHHHHSGGNSVMQIIAAALASTGVSG